MKKILFVAQNLEIAGMSKALVSTLKAVVKMQEYDVSLFTFSSSGPLLAEIPSDISVITAGYLASLVATPFSMVLKSKKIVDILLRALLYVLVRITGAERLYRYILKKSKFVNVDIAVSYFTDVPGQYFNRGTNQFVLENVRAKKKYAWIHSDPIDAKFDAEYCRDIYEDFDKIVCVSEAVKTKFDQFLPEYKNKTTVVHNVFDTEEIIQKSKQYIPFEKGEYDIITVCRVDNISKRIDDLVYLCKRLLSDGIDGFKWRIVGDGPDLKSNTDLTKRLGLNDFLQFEGEKINPYPYVANSDLFVLYSAYEGHPMVVGEAISLQTAVLTLPYAAAREQVLPGYGVVAKDEQDFYELLKGMIVRKNAGKKIFTPHQAEGVKELTDLLKRGEIQNDI